MNKSSNKTTQMGYAAVELTLALPFLLMMFAIAADFGRMYIQYTTLTKAVQDGARWAIYGVDDEEDSSDDTSEENIASISEIQNIVVYGEISSSSSPLLPSFDTEDVSVNNTDTEYVVVTADYQYAPLFANIPYLTQNLDLTLTASSLMRK